MRYVCASAPASAFRRRQPTKSSSESRDRAVAATGAGSAAAARPRTAQPPVRRQHSAAPAHGPDRKREADLEEQQRHRDRSEEPAQRIVNKRPFRTAARRDGQGRVHEARTGGRRRRRSGRRGETDRPQLLLLLPARGAGCSAALRLTLFGAGARDHGRAGTPISVDQQEDCSRPSSGAAAARMVWAQARIVIPIYTYVAFKDELGGAANIVPLVLAVLDVRRAGALPGRPAARRHAAVRGSGVVAAEESAAARHATCRWYAARTSSSVRPVAAR